MFAERIIRSDHPDGPKESSVHIVPPHVLDSEPVSFAVRHWDILRGSRRYPTRDEIFPRDIAGVLRHIVLIRVLDAGDDFEYRIVGDAHVQAHESNFAGMRLKEIEKARPGFDPNTRATYEFVRFTGEPLAVRGWVGRDVPESKFCYYETAFLPLGTETGVDHLLVVTSYVPYAGAADFQRKKA
ncbi:MAG: PAS domain-containing protein [Proteobacteria bacterium]|nr:PAS domain-containing protein [Pseudomonadota bacterium]